MIVSWNWLKQYLTLDMPPEEFEQRLMMAGLNHESTEKCGDDLAIDLEVTSNRPDCLGHLGIAREAAALFNLNIKLPAATPAETGPAVADLAKVVVECADLCPRYTARVIRGVKVGPSPAWLVNQLQTVGINSISNVVDVTNYVLMECGQPLHAFDLNRLRGRQILVRRAKAGEKFLAIDHKTYELTPDVCVIADAERAVGLAGVMGGADSEVEDTTTELLIESADFSPVSIRNTARRLKLHSDSSYRFERGVDPQGIDWASRRACELILDLAGGELASGVIDIGPPPAPIAPVVLRLSQLKRILGIEIPADEVRRILAALGLKERKADQREVEVVPPSWRRDLTREIDLVEEVARIYGYDAIPEDIVVPLAPSHRSDLDRVQERIRHTLTALGFDEAMNISTLDEEYTTAFSPWSSAPPIQSATPVLERADRLRRSLIPSLLIARRTNERLMNETIELFEMARVYLPKAGQLPDEPWLVGLCSGGDFLSLKGAVEALVAGLNPQLRVMAEAMEDPLFSSAAARLMVSGQVIGIVGELSQAGLSRFELRQKASVAEIKVAELIKLAQLTPKYEPLSSFPFVSRDLNLVVAESVNWGDLATTIRVAAGPLLEELRYRETFRHETMLGAGRKSLLCTLTFRGREETLTTDQVDGLVKFVCDACRTHCGAELRA